MDGPGVGEPGRRVVFRLLGGGARACTSLRIPISGLGPPPEVVPLAFGLGDGCCIPYWGPLLFSLFTFFLPSFLSSDSFAAPGSRHGRAQQVRPGFLSCTNTLLALQCRRIIPLCTTLCTHFARANRGSSLQPQAS